MHQQMLMKTILLFIHIFFGSCGLISGTISMILKKGNEKHKKVGRIFTVSMILTGLSAILITFIKPNDFLAAIGIFTIYMSGSGYMALNIKKYRKVLKGLIVLGLLSAIRFIALGIVNFIEGSSMGFVNIVFAGILIGFIYKDIQNLRKGNVRSIPHHLQRMCGAYISALTAFLVVNSNNIPFRLPVPIYWLLPTIVVTPFIIKWSALYTNRKAKITAKK